MQFNEIPEFQRDVKQFLKKFRTIRDDLKILEKVLATEGTTHPQAHLSYRIPSLGFESPPIIKVKKFACKSLKGKGANTGFRIIYAYYPQKQLIQFIEIYLKADQENEDKGRILRHFRVNPKRP